MLYAPPLTENDICPSPLPPSAKDSETAGVSVFTSAATVSVPLGGVRSSRTFCVTTELLPARSVTFAETA